MNPFSWLTSSFRSALPVPTTRPSEAGGGFLNTGGFLSGGLFGRYVYGSPNTSGVAVNERTAMSLPAFFAGVNIISSDLSTLPLELVQKMGDGSTRKATEHPCWPMFARSPDGVSTSCRWRAALISHGVVYGGGYAEIVPAIDGSRIYAYLLDPDRVQVVSSPEGGLHYQTGGGVLPPDKVIHFAGLSHDGITGHPIVQIAREAIGLGLAGNTFAGSYLGNGVAPAGYFESPEALTAEARSQFLQSIEERHSGPVQAGRVGLLPPGWKFNESKGGANPESAQLLDLRSFSVKDVARLLRIPLHKLADMSAVSYASIEASNLEYVQGTLLPWAEALEQSLNLRLLTDDQVAAGYTFRHDFKSLLRADAAGRAALYTVLFNTTAITPNEIRAQEGLPPRDGGDEVLTPLNMTTVSQGATVGS